MEKVKLQCERINYITIQLTDLLFQKKENTMSAILM